MCEVFGCLPTEADAELDRLPAGTIPDLLTLKAFMAAVAEVERVEDPNTLPSDGIWAIAKDAVFGRIQRLMDEKKRAAESQDK